MRGYRPSRRPHAGKQFQRAPIDRDLTYAALYFFFKLRIGLLAMAGLWMLSADSVAGDVTLGNIVVTLPPPAGHCALDRVVDADADLLDDIHEALGRTQNKLLSATANCSGLKDWREGRRRFIGETAQYQILTSFEARPAPANAIKTVCAQMRAQGERSSPEVQARTQAALEAVIKDVKVNEIRQWFLAEDTNTCYAAQFQKSIINDEPFERLSINAITVVRAG
jgi:hypothetical protein